MPVASAQTTACLLLLTRTAAWSYQGKACVKRQWKDRVRRHFNWIITVEYWIYLCLKHIFKSSWLQWGCSSTSLGRRLEFGLLRVQSHNMTELNKWSTVSEDRFCSIFPFRPSTPLPAPSVHIYPLSPHFPSPPTSVLGWPLDKLIQFVLPAKKVHTHSFTRLSSAILISWGAVLFSNKHQS